MLIRDSEEEPEIEGNNYYKDFPEDAEEQKPNPLCPVCRFTNKMKFPCVIHADPDWDLYKFNTDQHRW